MGLVEFCRDLVSLRSMSGDEGEAARRVREEMEALGYDRVSTDAYGSVIGVIQGEEEEAILLDGHMDTVDATTPEQWSSPPFTGTLRGGRIYGRGSTDMKGPLASAIYGAADVRGHGGRPRMTVAVSASVLEEPLEGVGLEKVIEEIMPKQVVICEPSNMRLVRAQKGRAELQLVSRGVAGHSSTPEKAINAVKKILPALQELNSMVLPVHPVLGGGVLELTDIKSDPYPALSVIPESCMVTYDRRLLVGETEESIVAEVEGVLDRFRSGDPKFDVRVKIAESDLTTYTGVRMRRKKFAPSWITDEDHHLVRRSRLGLKRAGLSSELGAVPFCTNGSYTGGRLGLPTVIFGPSTPALAHVVDEFVEIGDLETARRAYASIIREVSGIG